jgi:hypothetical protein
MKLTSFILSLQFLLPTFSLCLKFCDPRFVIINFTCTLKKKLRNPCYQVEFCTELISTGTKCLHKLVI